MDTAVIGKGLIGGSVEKAALRAGFRAEVFRGRAEVPDLSSFDIVFVALPPSATVPKIRDVFRSGKLKEGATVVDIVGVKESIVRELSLCPGGPGRYFVPGHPMAGKEKTGYGNSCENLFDGASMILTPYGGTPPQLLERMEKYFSALGFARTVKTSPEAHDRLIAYTSQLCHIISSAYVRDPLSARHSGFSAGSFRDMVRVGAPDPDVWTELFLANAKALLPVLDGYLDRLSGMRDAISSGDAAALHAILERGVEAKKDMQA